MVFTRKVKYNLLQEFCEKKKSEIPARVIRELTSANSNHDNDVSLWLIDCVDGVIDEDEIKKIVINLADKQANEEGVELLFITNEDLRCKKIKAVDKKAVDNEITSKTFFIRKENDNAALFHKDRHWNIKDMTYSSLGSLSSILNEIVAKANPANPNDVHFRRYKPKKIYETVDAELISNPLLKQQFTHDKMLYNKYCKQTTSAN